LAARGLPYAGQFVWLELDYDDPHNASFIGAHAPGIPVLLVMDPATGEPYETWGGSATLLQISELLTRALARDQSAATLAFERGDALFSRGDSAAALAAYEQALAAGGPAWPQHGHVLEQVMNTVAGDARACVARAAAEAPAMQRDHSFVSVALTGVQCLDGDPSLHGGADGARVEQLATEALDVPSASEDEHFMLFEELYYVKTAAGDAQGAHALAERYLAYVEERPPSTAVDTRMARDQALLRATSKVGTPERAIPTLEVSERELADAPSAERLASAYAQAKRWPDAIAAATRGLARTPGPTEQTRLLCARAAAALAQGDHASAKRDLDIATEAAARIGPAKEKAFAQQRISQLSKQT
jgi:tetratricopeptide (TPR) repeat protein